MSDVNDNQNGFVMTLVVIAVVVVVGYITWQNFLQSDEGQKLQETTNQVIDTIENTKETLTQ